jgi:D-alanyl-D-alanine dipeptidase
MLSARLTDNISKVIIYPIIVALISGCQRHTVGDDDPVSRESFLSLSDVEPDIVLEMRYFGENNFTGMRIDGYAAPKCLLTTAAANALANVQKELMTYGLGLKVYDCYRPQRAVAHFVAWAQDLNDTRMRRQYYPSVEKQDLFRLGYIAEKSSHSRGSTVDVTLVPLPIPATANADIPPGTRDCRAPAAQRYPDTSIDMGTGFDCFDPLAHTANVDIPAEARRNRLLLKSLMEKHGFVNYPKEWWHYTLRDEPFPERAFDFPVK